MTRGPQRASQNSPNEEEMAREEGEFLSTSEWASVLTFKLEVSSTTLHVLPHVRVNACKLVFMYAIALVLVLYYSGYHRCLLNRGPTFSNHGENAWFRDLSTTLQQFADFSGAMNAACANPVLHLYDSDFIFSSSKTCNSLVALRRIRPQERMPDGGAS